MGLAALLQSPTASFERAIIGVLKWLGITALSASGKVRPASPECPRKPASALASSPPAAAQKTARGPALPGLGARADR